MIAIEHINRTELFAISLPEATESYTPVSNRFILDTIDNMTKQIGLSLKAERYDSSRQGNIVIGNLNYEGTDPDLGIKIAFKNSYDKSRSFGIAAGANVWVCLNGMIRGEVVMNRVHTGEARMVVNQQIHMAFNAIIEEYKKMINARSLLQETPMSRRQAQSIVADLFFQEKTISSIMLNIIKKTWDNQHGHFAPIDSQEFTAWDCYNHITESLKNSHPSDYISNHISVHRIMSNFLETTNEGSTIIQEIKSASLFDDTQEVKVTPKSIIILPQ